MEIFKVFKFDAAHRLPNVGHEHKCSRLHGHSFSVEIHIRGLVDPVSGWVMDFADIVEAFKPLHEQLDHKYLNERGMNFKFPPAFNTRFCRQISHLFICGNIVGTAVGIAAVV